MVNAQEELDKIKKANIIDEEKLQQLINSEIVKIHGTIKSIEIFPTWWNPNCALIVNKVLIKYDGMLFI